MALVPSCRWTHLRPFLEGLSAGRSVGDPRRGPGSCSGAPSRRRLARFSSRSRRLPSNARSGRLRTFGGTPPDLAMMDLYPPSSGPARTPPIAAIASAGSTSSPGASASHNAGVTRARSGI